MQHKLIHMKKILIGAAILIVTIAVLINLTGSDRPDELFTVKQSLPGLEISNPNEFYDEYRGQYKVTAKVTNTGTAAFQNLQLSAKMLDADGKEIASPIGGTGKVINPGDTAIIQTVWLIPEKDNLPRKIELSATN